MEGHLWEVAAVEDGMQMVTLDPSREPMVTASQASLVRSHPRQGKKFSLLKG
jgi:hypothetical protein